MKSISLSVAIVALVSLSGCSMFKNKDTYRESKMYNVVETPPMKKQKAPKQQ